MDNSFKLMQKLNAEIDKEIKKYKRQLFFGSVFPTFSIDESLPGVAVVFKTIIDILFAITLVLSVVSNNVYTSLYLIFSCITGCTSATLTGMYYKWAKEDISYVIEDIKQEVFNKYKICENFSTNQQNTEKKELKIGQTNVVNVEPQVKKTTSIAPIIHRENNEFNPVKTKTKKLK